MKTYYILGTNKITKELPVPKEMDLFEVQANSSQEAVKIASKKSDKRYFCCLNLTVLNKEDLAND